MTDHEIITDAALDKQLEGTTLQCVALVGDLRGLEQRAEHFLDARGLQEPQLPSIDVSHSEDAGRPGRVSVQTEMLSRLTNVETALSANASRKAVKKKRIMKTARESLRQEILDLQTKRNASLASLRGPETTLRDGVGHVKEKLAIGYLGIAADHISRKLKHDQPLGLNKLRDIAATFQSVIMTLCRSFGGR